MNITTGQQVTFSQGDDAATILTGTISRVWPGGLTVTIKTPGAIAGTVKTFVRDITAVKAV